MEKIAKGAITLPWAFGLLLPFNGKVLSAQEHGTQVAKGPLGTVEFPVSCTGILHARRGAAACAHVRRIRGSVPGCRGKRLPAAPWRIGGWR